MSGDLQRVGDVVSDLDLARKSAPSEISLREDGTPAVIQWEGTPVSRLWLTGYVDRLIAARLVEPYAGLGRDLSAADRAMLERDNTERLGAWHRALGGLPQELLEQARLHFERHGLPAEWRRGYLKPSDVSRWVRSRARRRIPDGDECSSHPGEWADSCRPCAEERRGRRAQLPAGFMERLRAELEQQIGASDE